MKRFMDLMGTICMVLGFTVAGFFVFASIFVMRNATMQEVVLAYGFQTCSALLVLSLVEFKISGSLPSTTIPYSLAWAGALFSFIGWLMLVATSVVWVIASAQPAEPRANFTLSDFFGAVGFISSLIFLATGYAFIADDRNQLMRKNKSRYPNGAS